MNKLVRILRRLIVLLVSADKDVSTGRRVLTGVGRVVATAAPLLGLVKSLETSYPKMLPDPWVLMALIAGLQVVWVLLVRVDELEVSDLEVELDAPQKTGHSWLHRLIVRNASRTRTVRNVRVEMARPQGIGDGLGFRFPGQLSPMDVAAPGRTGFDLNPGASQPVDLFEDEWNLISNPPPVYGFRVLARLVSYKPPIPEPSPETSVVLTITGDGTPAQTARIVYSRRNKDSITVRLG